MKNVVLRLGLFLILVCATVSVMFGQVEVSGRLLDEDSLEPLAGGLVILENGDGAVSDNNGFFSIKLEPGTYKAEVKYLGYETNKLEINTDAPDLGNIVLSVSSTFVREVIINSVSLQNYKRDYKGSNYRVNSISLKNISPLSTEEVLRTVPGVNIVGDMGLSNRPNISIRGSWGRRSKKVLLMEDGSPAAPAPYIAPGAYYNPVSDRVTGIEVYKGADMLRFGPNNMYGAVNYITALPPQKPELRVKLVGGQRKYATGLLSYGGTWNNLGVLVEGVYKTFGGFTDNSSVDVLNLNAKLFAKLGKNQSLYFKVSGQSEDNQASLSSQTPFTFDTDPTQNPLDADQFTMRRYGVDIIHKWLPKPNLSITSKVYASDFERDWWRQVTAKVRASEVQNYVGDEIFNNRYGYLKGLNFDDEDYVIVGRMLNGYESTTDSRWTFTVSGIKETLDADWKAFGKEQLLEVGVKMHQETFKDRFLQADSSRWARNGTTVKDHHYYLWSASGYARNEFRVGKFGITPIVRFEHIDMYRQDLMAGSQNPNLSGTDEGRQKNIYNVILPGITLDYEIPGGEVFGSAYEGFIAPSKVFGFLVEQNGVVSNPLDGQDLNMKPELSLNSEIGWRGSLLNDRLSGQVTYFNNTVRNFYAGGRNEVFEELGKINVQGAEAAVGFKVLHHLSHKLRLNCNVNFFQSRVVSGRLNDKDLFSQVIHNTATQDEFISKVNKNRDAYEIYVLDGTGVEVLLTDEILTQAVFGDITRSVIRFGEGGIKDARAPYSPALNITAGVDYSWKKLSAGVMGNYVGSQFTEFHNFTKESSDGAIGELPAFFTLDAFVNYDFTIGEKTRLNASLNGKNLTNQIYRASRLNRATSGLFPGGFRQIIVGINMTI